MYLLLAVVAAYLVPKATVLQRDALRNVAVLLTLVPLVIASRPLHPTWTGHPGAGRSTAPPPSPT